MMVEMRCRNTTFKPQSENHGITQLLLGREHRSILDRQAAFAECRFVGRLICDVADPNAVNERLRAGSKSEIVTLGPVQEIVTAFETRLGIIGDLVPRI